MSTPQAVENGVRFLKQQIREGAYGLSCLGSDGTPRVSHNKGHLFSAFFICEAAADLLDELERAAIVVRLLSEEANGHWGYAPRATWDGPPDNPFFVDADDTAFALRTMRRLELYRSPEVLAEYYRTAQRSLLRPSKRLAGFVTFKSDRAGSLCWEPSPASNFEMHPEVNANVFLAAAGTGHAEWIAPELVTRSQAPEGYWHSFFYPGRFYATAMFMELIAQIGGLEEEREAGLRFLRDSQNSDGSWGEPSGPLETAQALRALYSGGERNEQGLTFLTETQLDDGSWHSDSVVWEFHENEHDIWRAQDVNRVVTTALAVAALRQGER